MNKASYGGLLSFLALVIAVILFLLGFFGKSFDNWSVDKEGLLGLAFFAGSFVLARLGL